MILRNGTVLAVEDSRGVLSKALIYFFISWKGQKAYASGTKTIK